MTESAAELIRCTFVVLGNVAHKRPQIACVGFVRLGRVRLRVFCLHDTGRNFALQILPLIVSIISLTANEKPR